MSEILESAGEVLEPARQHSAAELERTDALAVVDKVDLVARDVGAHDRDVAADAEDDGDEADQAHETGHASAQGANGLGGRPGHSTPPAAWRRSSSDPSQRLRST